MSWFLNKPGSLSWNGLANFGTFDVSTAKNIFFYFTELGLQLVGTGNIHLNRHLWRTQRRSFQSFEYEIDAISTKVKNKSKKK